MEIVIAAFIGAWISVSAVIAYRHIKKEYADLLRKDYIMENEHK